MFIDGSCVRLVLIDTAGLHPFPAMRELRMRTGNVFIFVFSYDSTESLDEAMRLFFDLKRVKGASPFISMKSLWLYSFKYTSSLTDLPN